MTLLRRTAREAENSIDQAAKGKSSDPGGEHGHPGGVEKVRRDVAQALRWRIRLSPARRQKPQSDRPIRGFQSGRSRLAASFDIHHRPEGRRPLEIYRGRLHETAVQRADPQGTDENQIGRPGGAHISVRTLTTSEEKQPRTYRSDGWSFRTKLESFLSNIRSLHHSNLCYDARRKFFSRIRVEHPCQLSLGRPDFRGRIIERSLR